MKTIQTTFFALSVILMTLLAGPVNGQFMPVVYDHVYGRENTLGATCADFQNGDVVIAGVQEGKVFITWISRNGESRFSKNFPAEVLSHVTGITPLSQNKVLITGTRKSTGKGEKQASGRTLILQIGGVLEQDYYVGEAGTVITSGRQLRNGDMILSGNTPVAAGGTVPFICKVSGKGQVKYQYRGASGETCNLFDVMGSNTEYVNAAFSSSGGKGCQVVRLDENGKPYFITPLPDDTFRIEKMSSAPDGNIYLVGQGAKSGGTVLKIRPEGDVVFNKQMVPAGADARLDHLMITRLGDLLIGGSGEKKGYFFLLRPDGTALSSNIVEGEVTGLTTHPGTGECVVAAYNPLSGFGKVIKLSPQGKKLYEKNTAASYTTMRINNNGEVLLASPHAGRLSMLSKLGELLFDRYVVENQPQVFKDAHLPANGEAVFVGTDTRVAKLAHGIYVSDIVVNKPISGYTSAVFTVTLSGYPLSEQGAPQPVTVKYKTRPGSAVEGLNFNPVSGTLSFVPSADGSDRYMNAFTVEVPVNANDLLEGERFFEFDLHDVRESYLIKPGSRAVIEDQPAVVKLIRTSAGTEGEKDIMYELGIFKTNGTPLINATRTDVVIDGFYGNGTADPLDFEMGHAPRLVIAPEQHSGRFEVICREDTRYESVKTVVVNFNKIFAMSDTQVSFGSQMLACEGLLYDQPAMVTIESLGNHNQLNNVLAGLFKVSLVRAKDGVLLTNNSGSDILLSPVVNESATAKQGVDFVLANHHDLRIWGDDRSSAVNLNGMILYSPDKGEKTVSVSLSGVKAGEHAGKIKVDPNKNSAHFIISKQE